MLGEGRPSAPWFGLGLGEACVLGSPETPPAPGLVSLPWTRARSGQCFLRLRSRTRLALGSEALRLHAGNGLFLSPVSGCSLALPGRGRGQASLTLRRPQEAFAP